MTIQEYEHIVGKVRPQLIRLGRSFFQNDDLAEDAAQEALLRLWLLRERLDDTSHAEALLLRMVKNICVSLWRKSQKEILSIEENMVLTREVTPMADDENTRLLVAAISQLTPSEQRLFRMRQELGMDIAQIATVTGMTQRSVSTVVSTARRKILEQLKKGGIL